METKEMSVDFKNVYDANLTIIDARDIANILVHGEAIHKFWISAYEVESMLKKGLQVFGFKDSDGNFNFKTVDDESFTHKALILNIEKKQFRNIDSNFSTIINIKDRKFKVTYEEIE